MQTLNTAGGKGGNTRMPDGVRPCLNMLRNIISSVKPAHLCCFWEDMECLAEDIKAVAF